MSHSLKLHPDSRRGPVRRIDADALRLPSGLLALRYEVTGRIDDLRIPSLAASAQADELWRHTCFEAFLSAPPLRGYYEFNFSPSTQWAAYLFDKYRDDMRAAEGSAPRIDTSAAKDSFTLEATLKLDELPELPLDAIWRLGLSAIIEEADGAKSYWALAHPSGKPDFHHADCFALQLSPASRA